MNLVVDNFVHAAKYGIRATDDYGRSVHVLIDNVDFFDYHPAVTPAADLMGHTANYFCSLCTVKRNSSTLRSEIVYFTPDHSRRFGYMRFDEPMDAVRSATTDVSLRRALGLRCASKAAASSLPSVKLS